jgi:hypothetical protein
MVFSKSHYNIIKKRRIENIVKENGRLIFATTNDDYDDGRFLRSKFMERNKEYFKIAEEFVEKYNPDNLSREGYRIAYSENKLKWQV